MRIRHLPSLADPKLRLALATPVFLLAVALAAKCGDASAASASAQLATDPSSPQSTSHSDPKKFCAALLPQVQALITLPLTLMSADDSHSDVMHTGEDGYVSCVNGNGGYRATVIMSSDPGKKFTSEPKKGYDALAGFGDVARSAHSSYQWVDVMKGNAFCEAIVTIDDKDLKSGDWKQTGGKMCMAAFGTH
ncbi:MAG TPA: hypothetical protein VK511_12030 [Gemmatimonadaceae bacterium]|nr:hypothetical protein [Gemmatimonadaceae bacterium]